MDPRLRSSIPVMTARVHNNVPVALTASTRFQSSSLIFATGALCATPALLMRMSTGPAWPEAAFVRSATLAASVTSQCTAHALPPATRISTATRSMRSVLRAATTTAAPSAARACATAAPIPWPPPVTTATAPSNLRTHRLLEDRAQRVDEARAFIPGRGRGIAEVGTRSAGRREGALARLDRLGQGLGVRGEGLANVIADGIRPFAEDNRGFEPTRVTGPAPELIAQTRAPRFMRQVGEDDRQQPVSSRELHSFVQCSEMLRVKVHVRERQQAEPLV